jgi:hypothetical protein
MAKSTKTADQENARQLATLLDEVQLLTCGFLQGLAMQTNLQLASN